MLGRDVDFATLVEDALDDLEDFELRQQQPPLPEEPSYFAHLKGTLTHVLTIPLLAKEKATRALAARYAAARRLLANRFVVYDFLERDVPIDTPIRYVVALARARAIGAVPALLTSPLRALASPLRAVSPQKKKRGLSARDPNVPPSPPKSPAKDYGPPLW